MKMKLERMKDAWCVMRDGCKLFYEKDIIPFYNLNKVIILSLLK